jgi:hypothetical protein
MTGTPRRRAATRAVWQALIPIAVGALLTLRHRRIGGPILMGLGTLILLAGLLAPGLFERWERLGRAVARGVGTLMTWLVLVPFFYLVFLPARVVLAMARRDPMRRAFPTQEATYWVARPPARPDHYTRQF